MTVTVFGGYGYGYEKSYLGYTREKPYTGAAHRNRLSVEAFEALQILKSTYQNGHVVAINHAAQHIDALIMDLEDFREEDGI
jgi:hypothetical protein